MEAFWLIREATISVGLMFSSAHLQEMGTSVFVGNIHQLVHIVDFAYGCDGKTAEMRLYEKRLRLVV